MLSLTSTLKQDLLRYVISIIVFVESAIFGLGKCNGKQSPCHQEIYVIQWDNVIKLLMWCPAQGSCLKHLVSFFLCENRHQHKELWDRGSIWAEHRRINKLRRGRQYLGIISKLRERFQVYTILGILF